MPSRSPNIHNVQNEAIIIERVCFAHSPHEPLVIIRRLPLPITPRLLARDSHRLLRALRRVGADLHVTKKVRRSVNHSRVDGPHSGTEAMDRLTRIEKFLCQGGDRLMALSKRGDRLGNVLARDVCALPRLDEP